MLTIEHAKALAAPSFQTWSGKLLQIQLVAQIGNMHVQGTTGVFDFALGIYLMVKLVNTNDFIEVVGKNQQ